MFEQYIGLAHSVYPPKGGTEAQFRRLHKQEGSPFHQTILDFPGMGREYVFLVIHTLIIDQ